ncbi:MAG TPA: GspE/PulE family protein [Acidimicrobiia bacterium]
MIHELVTGRSVPGRARIGELFVNRGLVKQEDLDAALELQRETGRKIGETLVDLGHATTLQVAHVLADRLGLDFVDLDELTLDTFAAQRIPEEVARRYRALPLDSSDTGVRLAVADPTNVFAIDDLSLLLGKPVVTVVADSAQLDTAIDRIWSGSAIETTLGDATDEQEAEEDLELASTSDDDGPIVRLVDAIIAQAVDERASDIHVEPGTGHVRIRFRVDGVLHDASTAPLNVLRPLISRLKILAGCDISHTRVPQDGRFSSRVRGRTVDIRMTTLPTGWGEAAVLRLLDTSGGVIQLDALGFEPAELERYREAASASQGAIVTSGPTGSGKTSTMYATLLELNTPGRSIVSVEDPIEYQLDGVKQVQVTHRGGVGFASALRSILRADPDIILVGEVRDPETARIAAEAALTGHLVLTTIHTTSASAVPVRLIDMGVEPYLVTSALHCVVAQRLIRTLCDKCAASWIPDEEEIRLLGLTDDDVEAAKLRERVGCQACSGTGYNGRTAIYEVLPIDDEIHGLIAHGANAREIEATAIAHGMQTLRSAAVRKLINGVCGLDELVRVVS